MTIQEVAAKILIQMAWLLFHEGKWSRIDCVDADGNVCLASSDQCVKWTLLGAISAARSHYHDQGGMLYHTVAAAHDEVYQHIVQAIFALHPYFRATRSGATVTEFNEAPDRIFQEIREVVTHAYRAITRQTMHFNHLTKPL